jgi:hypothetical protein
MPSPSSFSAIKPPKECPMITGLAGSAAMILAKWSVASSMPTLATASGCTRASSTVDASPGQPGAIGS